MSKLTEAFDAIDKLKLAPVIQKSETWTGPSGTEYDLASEDSPYSCEGCCLFVSYDDANWGEGDCGAAPCEDKNAVLRRKETP